MTRDRTSLSGTWDFRFADDADWRPIAVPGCWENLGIDKKLVGPAVYRTTFDVPRDFAGRRAWLRFDAVSYHCAVRVNGREVGRHTGAWDAFDVEVTDAVKPGERSELTVEVEKPASLTKGPGSPHLPGRFPLKQTLCGFLPYVWGHMFGGIWQDVWLYSTGRTIIEDVLVRGDEQGAVRVTARCSAEARWTLSVRDSTDRIVSTSDGRGAAIDARFQIREPRPWSPHAPALYTATIELDDGDARSVRFGLRAQSVAADGSTILLNGHPVYPRMILSWGWYPASPHANPGPERVRADFERLRAMGYNGVKLCLWCPPQYYFDLADETGMMLALELPMWMPEPGGFFRRQVFEEYPRLMKLARQHPSVVLVTLGCELDKTIGPDVLAPLFTLAREHFPDALLRDNSGGGDAYGGLLDEHADFYDYHFYSDLHFFTPLLDYFSPRRRAARPWVFGEFCDSDTFRDLRHLHTAHGDEKPWWTRADEKLNPQGARWQYDVVEQEERLKAIGYWTRGDELVRVSNRQALLHRKWTLETARAYREVSGYVVTGEADTPVSTAGMWDDLGQAKFDASEFRAFNDDLIVLLGWDKRRAWVHGGDRAAYWDTWSYATGQTIRAHVVVSNYSRAAGKPTFQWRLEGTGVAADGKRESSEHVDPGMVREIGLINIAVPPAERPQAVVLHVSVNLGGVESRNAWPLWWFPADRWNELRGVALIDPLARLSDLRESNKALATTLAGARLAVAMAWSGELEAYLSGGGRAVLLQGAGPPGPVPTAPMPFWREAIRIIEPHPAWGAFPLDDGVVGLQFFGCATDRALDTSNLDRPTKPILRRLDARTSRLHDYATEVQWGRGRLIVSTLRFEGGHGTQPRGITRNTAASYLLWCWVKYLTSV